VGTLWSLGVVALGEARAGHYAAAETLFQERIALGQEVGAMELAALGYAHLSYHVYFVQGNFSQALTAAEQALKIATERHYSDPAGWALVTLGLLASMEDRYQDGNALCQQGASAGFLADIADYAAWGSSIAACGLGDYDTAIGLFPAALKYGAKTRGLVGIVMCLPVAALIFAHQGDTVRATELLALAFAHPIRASGWMEKWRLLMRLRADIENALGSEEYHAAWERGKLLDAEAVAAELQEKFRKKGASVHEKWHQPRLQGTENGTATYGLSELTEREREVLELIAQGMTNLQIANELVLSPKTVRNHITNIFSKLQVARRAQAIIRARDAGFG
jgi:DNA-binding CsgD family transcriptional regulator